MRTGTEIEINNGINIEINITWIRHGMTAANAAHRYLGRTDEPLSAEGEVLLSRKWDGGGLSDCDILFSGPMLRCRQTAALLYPKKTAILIPEWTEMDFGRFEGKNYQELASDADYQRWIDSNGTLPFPEGEGREAFLARSMRGFARMAALLREAGQSVGIWTDGGREKTVSGIPGAAVPQGICETAALRGICEAAAVVHGGTIMAVLSSLMGGEYFDFQVKNGEGYRSRILLGESKTEVLELTKL